MTSRASQSGALRLLHVICTPRGLGSNTGRVASCLLEELREQDDDLEVKTLDLFRTDLPSVAGKNIESKYRLMTGQDLDDDAHSSWSEIERTIEQFLDGHQDVERRRKMADSHAADAAASATLAEAGDVEARSRALRQAGAALALVPAHRQALGTLARVLLSPPKSMPEAARAEFVERARVVERSSARGT